MSIADLQPVLHEERALEGGRARRLSVCALVPYPTDTVPGERFRIEQWQPYLEREGIDVEFLPFADEQLMRVLHQPGRLGAKGWGMASAFARRLGHLRAARRYDAVLIYRTVCLAGPAVLERAMGMLGWRLLFDFDDAIFMLHSTRANRWVGWLKFPGKTEAICRQAAHVTVGNSYLASYAMRFNRNVTVIPSSVDTDLYRPVVGRRPNERPIVGWTGSSTSQTHLEMFAPFLREFVASRAVEIRVISDREPVLPGVPFVWRPWSPATEVEELARFDVGIMPMPDDEWSLGKCAMKALLYMSMGIPAVCSAVGANREVIRHGVDGLLASTPAEWTEHLDALIGDPHLRRALGDAGRKTIEDRYSMERCAAAFARVVRESVA